jgi:K+-transporting ATPase KdpF subunit
MGAEPLWAYWLAGAAALALLIYLIVALFRAEDMA